MRCWLLRIGYATLTRRIYNPTVRAVSRSRALFHVCPCPTDSPHTHIFIHQDAQTKHTRHRGTTQQRSQPATEHGHESTGYSGQRTHRKCHTSASAHRKPHIRVRARRRSARQHAHPPNQNSTLEGRGPRHRAAHAILRDAQPVQACRRAPSAIRLECIAHRLRLGSKRLPGGGPAPPSRALGRPLPLGRGRFRSGPPASRASVGRRGLLSAGVAFSRPAWRG